MTATSPPFRYSDRGDVAVIGRLSGVTNIGWLGPLGRQGGFLAWMLWLGIHIVYLIGFANRIVVVTRWAWSFLTHGRGSDIMQPMAIPSVGGMAIQLLTLFIAPCLYCAVQEWHFRRSLGERPLNDALRTDRRNG